VKSVFTEVEIVSNGNATDLVERVHYCNMFDKVLFEVGRNKMAIQGHSRSSISVSLKSH